MLNGITSQQDCIHGVWLNCQSYIMLLNSNHVSPVGAQGIMCSIFSTCFYVLMILLSKLDFVILKVVGDTIWEAVAWSYFSSGLAYLSALGTSELGSCCSIPWDWWGGPFISNHLTPLLQLYCRCISALIITWDSRDHHYAIVVRCGLSGPSLIGCDMRLEKSRDRRFLS